MSKSLCYALTKDWRGINDEENDHHYGYPIVMKPRTRSDSLASAISGTITPGGGRKLSETDLAQADAALESLESHQNGGAKA